MDKLEKKTSNPNEFIAPQITEFQRVDSKTLKENLMAKLILPRAETFLATKTTEAGDVLHIELFVDINDGGVTKPIKFKIESNVNDFAQAITNEIQEHTKSLTQYSDLQTKSMKFQIILKNKDNLEKGFTTVRI